MIFSQTKRTPIETQKKMTKSKNMKNAKKKKKEGTEKKNRKKGNDVKKKNAKKQKPMEDRGKRVVAEAKLNKDGGNASVSLNA